MEQVGTLVPQAAIEVFPKQHFQLFDGSRIFVHAPQYHWHAVVAEGLAVVDQEARERIVSITDLLDRFCHRTNLHEEELWVVLNI